MRFIKMAALTGIALCAFAVLPLLARADPQQPEIQVAVTVVRRSSAAPPRLTANDVLVYQSHERRPVVSWTLAEAPDRRTDLAVLVDDSTGSSLGNQISDLKSFINSLPASVEIAIAYARHGDASILQNFTTSHAAAAKALRLPVGRPNEGSSIYMAVSDMVKRFPQDGNLHEIFLISDGIDLYRGVMDSEPGLNPDLNTAIHDALRAHVTVFTIFANAAGFDRRNLFLVNNGQSCLSLLTLSTGGESYFQGLQTPVSFQPYLTQLASRLRDQYVLTFRAASGSKPGMSSLRVTTEQPGVQLLAPRSVYIPAA